MSSTEPPHLKEAWEKAFRLAQLAFSRTNPGQQPEDIAQEVALKYWQAWSKEQLDLSPTIAEQEQFKGKEGWIVATARNAIRSHFRGPQARLATCDVIEGCSCPPITSNIDDVMEIDALLGKLSAADEALIRSRYLEELNTAAMALQMNVSEQCVKNRLHRAMNKLRCLARESQDSVQR